MSAVKPRCWRLQAPDDTQQLGAAFAMALARLRGESDWPADRAVRVSLSGALGSGKTTWVQGFAAGFGVVEKVTSPTYSLIQEHRVPLGSLVHADFYRLANSAELDALALDDFDRPDSVWCIEWPERAGLRLGQLDLALNLAIEAAEHSVRAEPRGRFGEKWLAAV